MQLQNGQQFAKNNGIVMTIHALGNINSFQQLLNMTLALHLPLHCHLDIKILNRSVFILSIQFDKTTFFHFLVLFTLYEIIDNLNPINTYHQLIDACSRMSSKIWPRDLFLRVKRGSFRRSRFVRNI